MGLGAEGARGRGRGRWGGGREHFLCLELQVTWAPLEFLVGYAQAGGRGPASYAGAGPAPHPGRGARGGAGGGKAGQSVPRAPPLQLYRMARSAPFPQLWGWGGIGKMGTLGEARCVPAAGDPEQRWWDRSAGFRQPESAGRKL